MKPMSKLFHSILALLILTLSAASCHRKENIPDNPEKPDYQGTEIININPLVDEDWQPIKAAYDPVDNAALRAGGFGVYAYYTGRESYSPQVDSLDYDNFGLIFKNRHFYYDDGWKHEGTDEFWPAYDGDKVTFQAYAPYSTWSSVVSYDGKVASIQYDNYVAQSLTITELEKQRDLLWGTNSSGLAHNNVSAKDYATEGTVDMHFRHAVAKLDFNIMGVLSGEEVRETGTGLKEEEYSEPGDPDPANPATLSSDVDFETQITLGNRKDNVTYTDRNNGILINYYRDYINTQTQTKTEQYTQYRYRIKTTNIPVTYTTTGNRYLIEEVSFKGFNQTGTLVLNNESAYAPTWTNVAVFDEGDPEYILSPEIPDNALTQSLRYVAANTVRDNYSYYTGISSTPVDLMNEHSLYAIPKTVNNSEDRIQVGLKYNVLYVNGSLSRPVTTTCLQVQSRVRKRTDERERVSHVQTVNRTLWIYPDPDYEAFVYDVEWDGDDEIGFDGWSDWDDVEWGPWNDVDDTVSPETIGELVMTGTPEVYYVGEAREMSNYMVSSLQGGRAYTISLVLAGDKLDLVVAPRPWELEESSYVYTSEVNEIIQALTYDSATIDYADAQGNVYINNRMGKFYFRLDSGKYVAWQASLVGDAAFGFTDEHGNFLRDGSGNLVNSIRQNIDPDVMNNIYVKAVDNTATVTSKAKLRIYYLDVSNNVTVALNLVNLQGVNEWTIVQNAN